MKKYSDEVWKFFWLNEILTISPSKTPSCRENKGTVGEIKPVVKVVLPLFYKFKWTWIYVMLTLQINVFKWHEDSENASTAITGMDAVL